MQSRINSRRGGARRALAVAIAVAAVAGVVTAAPADATKRRHPKPAPPISAAFFGMHHAGLHADGPIGWPQAPIGSVRMWDNKVSWREIEVAPGVFDWTLIDMEMAKARANGASVLLVLGQTPTFHSSRPTVVGSYGPGASSMPDKTSWVNYVQQVALRNRSVWGGIAQFQVWNEANVVGYWAGTPQQMATLTAWTRSALRSVDPASRLVAPALVTRLSSQQSWVSAFYQQRVAGKNVSAYVDALSFQLYPVATGTPESSMALLAAVRRILARNNISKPIWNTEVNYGMVSGAGSGTAPAISSARQVGNLMRTYVLNAGNRVSRVYWYSWDLLGMSNTQLVAADRITLTPAGKAFTTTRTWLQGARPVGCSRAKTGTWTCTFTTATQTRRIIWNPSRSTSVKLAFRASSVATWDSAATARPMGSRVAVGVVPVLVSTRR
jgi:hypothetical protein